MNEEMILARAAALLSRKEHNWPNARVSAEPYSGGFILKLYFPTIDMNIATFVREMDDVDFLFTDAANDASVRGLSLT